MVQLDFRHQTTTGKDSPLPLGMTAGNLSVISNKVRDLSLTETLPEIQIENSDHALDVINRESLQSSAQRKDAAMTGIIDADTHIAESESMWQFIDKNMYASPAGHGFGSRRHAVSRLQRHVADRRQYFSQSLPAKAAFALITPPASKRESNAPISAPACREITDVDARLADMDKAGVRNSSYLPDAVSD